jgi:hypothetical protein
MKLITRQILANEAARRFRATYNKPGWHDEAAWQPGQTKAQICVALESLGPTPSPDDVDRIIGNGSWTREYCGCCRTQPDRWVVVDASYGENVTVLCEDCVKKMAALFA